MKNPDKAILNLSSNSLNDQKIKKLFKNLKKNPKSINISNNKIGK